MSSIMDRLREVEGASLPHRTQGVRGQRTQSDPVARGRAGTRGGKAGPKAAAFCVVAGVLGVLAVFVIWRAWKAPPRGAEGKTLTQSRALGTVISPASRGSPASGRDSTDAEGVLAVAGGKNAPPGRGEKPPLGKGQRSPSSHAPPAWEKKGASAPLGVVTVEEDERTKRILRDLKVTGVYRDANGYLAFINGRELQKGDKIGPIEIAEIASERITFTVKRKRYILRLR